MVEQKDLTLPQEPTPLPEMYRRDIRIENCVLDQRDIGELFSLVQNKTNDAQAHQIEFEKATSNMGEEKIPKEVKEAFRINYRIRDYEESTLAGNDVPSLDSGGFPEDIQSIFISNTQVFRIAASGRYPRNCIEFYIDFKRPSMAINFLNMPSNPTNNPSVVNVYGYKEDWVISTHQKLREFFKSRQTNRGFIHRSGVYDLFLYAIFLPSLLWVGYRVESKFPQLFKDMGNIELAAIYIYGVVFYLIIARFIFQYLRWLFPIVEYKTKRSMGPKIHRTVIWGILSALGLGFLSDVIRTLFW